MRTLVELADTLVDDFDVIEMLTVLVDRCVELLDVSAAGVMLAAPDGDLRVAASSSEAMRVVELFEIQAQEGPCPDCFRSGEAIVNGDLASGDGRWPAFAPVALAGGFASVHAVPLRLRGHVVGALNLFGSGPGELGEADVVAARALADVATIAIVQHRVAGEAQVLAEQLTHALTSRVVIEQAKGVLAERVGTGVDEAFSRLRAFARRSNRRLTDVAQSLIDGSLDTALLGPPSTTG
ncbi:MAG: GAF and ANTAR domain-containing protein [Acidimicrobiales bacterium]